MACFLAPTGLAVITTALRKKIPEKYHIDWLNTMLWGGVIMLIVDHILSGEFILYPPFFTRGISEIIFEVLKIGVPMTLAVFVIWIVMVIITEERKEGTKILQPLRK